MTALSVMMAVWLATSVVVALVLAGLVRRNEARLPGHGATATRVRPAWSSAEHTSTR